MVATNGDGELSLWIIRFINNMQDQLKVMSQREKHDKPLARYKIRLLAAEFFIERNYYEHDSCLA